MKSDLGTIALVEDNEDDLYFMTRALKEAEVDNPLQVLKTGREAIDYLSGAGIYGNRALHPMAFLMLMDLKLPDISGFEVLRWIKGHGRLQPLITIVLTTSGEAKDIERAYQLGANSFLVKASGSDGVLEQVKALKQYWLVHNGFPILGP